MATILTIITMYWFYRWTIKIHNTPDEELSEFEKFVKHDDSDTTYPGYTVRRKKRH